jgi:hypothetical protein
LRLAGGGIAGLEALLALADLADARVETTLVAPTDEFVYKPLAVEEPSAPGSVEAPRIAADRRGRPGAFRCATSWAPSGPSDANASSAKEA